MPRHLIVLFSTVALLQASAWADENPQGYASAAAPDRPSVPDRAEPAAPIPQPALEVPLPKELGTSSASAQRETQVEAPKAPAPAQSPALNRPPPVNHDELVSLPSVRPEGGQKALNVPQSTAATRIFHEAGGLRPPPVNPDELVDLPIVRPDGDAPVAQEAFALPLKLELAGARPNGSPTPVVGGAPQSCGIAPDDSADSEDDSGDDDDDSADSKDDGADAEAESQTATPPATGIPDHLYTNDISDAELARLWKENRKALGTIAVGFADAGRLFNAEELPSDGPWTVTVPDKDWGTQETIHYLTSVFEYMDKAFPDGPPPRINGISKREGGYARPHRSHQTGRDVDIGFYYKDGIPGHRVRDRSPYMDLARNWAMLKALVTMTDVQFILVDRRIQKTLYDYALSINENKDWLDSLFHAGTDSLFKHARHHRDHFHVRFYNPRAQELGRRVQPLLAKDPEAKHIVTHRIRRGDTLGHIARRYGVTVRAIRLANGMRSNALRAGRTLAIPVRGPCTNCPVPPPVIVPARRLPPPKAPPTVG